MEGRVRILLVFNRVKSLIGITMPFKINTEPSPTIGLQQSQGLPGLRDCSKELPRPWYIKGLRRNTTVFSQ
ncbi:hypothetical protein B5X24_HaOG213461 [Helicoverpa armigera]|nr:hypothetical protein B5X24_HaOG213461 [Helicoverpa armigera]